MAFSIITWIHTVWHKSSKKITTFLKNQVSGIPDKGNKKLKNNIITKLSDNQGQVRPSLKSKACRGSISYIHITCGNSTILTENRGSKTIISMSEFGIYSRSTCVRETKHGKGSIASNFTVQFTERCSGIIMDPKHKLTSSLT